MDFSIRELTGSGGSRAPDGGAKGTGFRPSLSSRTEARLRIFLGFRDGFPFCRFLLEELQHALRELIGLRQHRLSALVEDAVLGVGHHLFGDVGVADGGLGVLDVLAPDAEVVDRVVEAVLQSAEAAARVGDQVDGVLAGLTDVILFSR